MTTTIQTMSVRKSEVQSYVAGGWAVSQNQLAAEQNPLGLVALEKEVPANTMLRGNAQWWKL